MGGRLSVTNGTEKRLVVQLEQNPVSIRYWGFVESGDTTRVWEHASGDPLNTGFFILRVIDVDSLPSPYQPPNLLNEQFKAAGFALLGIAGLGATGLIGLTFLITGSPNWKSPRWQIPPGSSTQHREVRNPVYIGFNTCYNVAESNGHLVLEKVGSNETTQAALFAHESPDLDRTPRPRRKDYHEEEPMNTSQTSRGNVEEINDHGDDALSDQPVGQATPTDSKSTVSLTELPEDVTFFDLEVIRCSKSGVRCNNLSEKYDVALDVPRGAVPNGKPVDIQLGVVSHANFSYPADMKIVSPVIWLCADETNISFKKPLEIQLAHFYDTSYEGGHKNLCFLKGDHSPKIVTGGKKHYNLTRAEGKATFREDYGTLSTKHFCFACIAAKKTVDFVHRSKYLLVAAVPEKITENTWSVYFCVTYRLQTCLECLREQMSANEYKLLETKAFQFKSGSDEAKLTIQFHREVDGWMIARSFHEEIKAKDIEFWEMDQDELRLREQANMYPPRFQLNIHSSEAKKNAVTVVEFAGSVDSLSSELVLDRGVLKRLSTLTLLSFASDSESSLSTSLNTDAVPDREAEIKDKIQANLLEFIRLTNWINILPLLIREKLLTDEEEEHLLNEKNPDGRKGLYFYRRWLPAKGPGAYFTFQKCLAEEKEHRGHVSLSKLLQTTTS